MKRGPSPLKSLMVAGMVLGLAIIVGMAMLGGIVVLYLSQHPVEL